MTIFNVSGSLAGATTGYTLEGTKTLTGTNSKAQYSDYGDYQRTLYGFKSGQSVSYTSTNMIKRADFSQPAQNNWTGGLIYKSFVLFPGLGLFYCDNNYNYGELANNTNVGMDGFIRMTGTSVIFRSNYTISFSNDYKTVTFTTNNDNDLYFTSIPTLTMRCYT